MRDGTRTSPQEGDEATLTQQLAACCIGGHLTEPKEQNTQQSPGFGRR